MAKAEVKKSQKGKVIDKKPEERHKLLIKLIYENLGKGMNETSCQARISEPFK